MVAHNLFHSDCRAESVASKMIKANKPAKEHLFRATDTTCDFLFNPSPK